MLDQDSFKQRPRVAHITNHGYAGVEVPYGGAPDTGGQNVYVNFIVETMAELGYHVTVFARGGFPFFESDQLREGVEPYGDHARYVYVPGGGDEFIRKEDIAAALEEEVDWLERFVDDEAEELDCAPWEVYDFVDCHYWDAGVIGMELGARWRARAGLELLAEVLSGVLDESALEPDRALGSHSTAGRALDQTVGRLLLEHTDAMAPLLERASAAVRWWCEQRAPAECERAESQVIDKLKGSINSLSPPVAPIAAAEIIGSTVLELWDPGCERSRAILASTDRQVFTPHSLAVLKEENYRDHPEEIRRSLKFCERRDHESAVCASARAFAATSTEIAERLRTHQSIPTEKIFYFPAGIDRRLFRRYRRDELDDLYEYLVERTGLPIERLEGAPIVFETSRMDRTKRKDILLGAFAQIAPQFPEALCLIGGGPDNDIVSTLASQLTADRALEGRAFLLGFIPDGLMYKLFGRADLFVTASEMEGFGLSAAQAAAVGSALVTSDLVPFALQYVPDEALIVRAGDVEGFAEAMATLLDDEGERRRRGQRLAEQTRMLDWLEQTKAFVEHLRRFGLAGRRISKVPPRST